MAEKPEIEIISQRTLKIWLPDEGEVPRTYVTYRDEKGRLDMIVLPLEDPSDEEISAAVKKRLGEAEKGPGRRIPV